MQRSDPPPLLPLLRSRLQADLLTLVLRNAASTVLDQDVLTVWSRSLSEVRGTGGRRASSGGRLGAMAVEVPGMLVGSGRNADVYDIGGGRVLRRYRDGRDARAVAREASVMVHARAFGVPVPEVFDVTGSDMVMERAVGPTMLQVIARQPWTVLAQARLLARMHALVHAVPADGLDLRHPFGTGELDGQVLLHRDLHPQNVLLTENGPMIIDWEGAVAGPAIADVAMTWVIIGFSQVPGPRIQAAYWRAVQAVAAREFARAAGPIDEAWRATAIRHRLADPNLLPAEAARLKRLGARQG